MMRILIFSENFGLGHYSIFCKLRMQMRKNCSFLTNLQFFSCFANIYIPFSITIFNIRGPLPTFHAIDEDSVNNYSSCLIRRLCFKYCRYYNTNLFTIISLYVK
jgi:hypothetical protein